MSSTSSPLQSSSIVEEFIAALQEIVANNDPCDRSEESVSIILTSKIQLIFNNRTNQDLLHALGQFFMWMMPFTESLKGAEREAETKEERHGKKICSRKDFEDLFVHQLLPYAKSSDAIYSLCGSVVRFAWKQDNTYFVTADARDELLHLVKNAPCQNSLHCALQAIHNLSNARKEGVPIESNPFVCDEVSSFAHKFICESTVRKIVERAAELLRIQILNSTPQFYATDPDFAQTMLRKLDEATAASTISAIASLIADILHLKQGNRQLFASSEAARVFLSKLNSSDDPQVLHQICRCINNIGVTLQNISDDFASPEICRAIFKCFSKQKEEISKEIIFRSIATLTRSLPLTRSTFAQECPGLTQAIIGTLATAIDDETRHSIAVVIVNISLDAESAKRLFNNVSIYEGLILAAARAKNEKTKNEIIIAMHNSTVMRTDFLPLCAARYPFYGERQIELLKLDSMDYLVSALENIGWVFVVPQDADFLNLRSIFIVLEKFDQFLEVLDQRIEAGDEKIEEMLLTIAKGFLVSLRTNWEHLRGDPFFDVTLSLLERSSGAANAAFAYVIYKIVIWNPYLTIYPSTALRLLQKLDNSKELRDREYNGEKMEFHIYKILETATIRSPELFRDNKFLVDNSGLIESCFERSFEIHELDVNSEEKSMLKTHVESLCKIDPRMKEKMEGWDGQIAARS